MTGRTEDDTTAAALALSMVEAARRRQQAGDARRALELAPAAVALARRSGDAATLAEALIVLSTSEWSLGDRIEQACTHALEAVELTSEGRGGVPLQAAALANLARNISDAGDPGHAAGLFLRAVTLLKGIYGDQPHGPLAFALSNMAVCLSRMRDYDEAAVALEESLAIWRRLPGSERNAVQAATNLASCSSERGQLMLAQGDAAGARALFERALAQLPPMDLSAWRSYTMGESTALGARATVQVYAGRTQDARQTIATLLRLARSRRSPTLFMLALHAQAALREALGEWSRALHHGRAALAYAERNFATFELDELELLASLSARSGDPVQALQYHRRWAALHARETSEGVALQGRLAALARRTERRRLAAREAMVHTERLALIGRLIAQTHHALQAPIDAVLRQCLLAQRQVVDAPAALAQTLAGVVREVDRAGALTRQLKLFSYRSSPRPMALSLREAVAQAHAHVLSHLGGDGARLVRLRLDVPLPAQAWADPQRLGILLAVLWIELLGGSMGLPCELSVSLRPRGARPGIGLQIDGPRPEPAGGASGGASGGAIGIALCREIAREMNGTLLQRSSGDGDGRRFELRLPDGAPPRRAAVPA